GRRRRARAVSNIHPATPGTVPGCQSAGTAGAVSAGIISHRRLPGRPSPGEPRLRTLPRPRRRAAARRDRVARSAAGPPSDEAAPAHGPLRLMTGPDTCRLADRLTLP